MYKVSFHKHDIVGAQKTKEMMENLGFNLKDTEYVSSLVRWHQFRFYPDTKESTYYKWIQKVKSKNIYDLFKLRAADRAGNLKNKDKPAINKEFKDLITKVDFLLNKECSLCVSKADIAKLGIQKEDMNYVIGCLKSAVYSGKLKNTKSDLLIEIIRMRNKQIEHNTNKDGDPICS